MFTMRHFNILWLFILWLNMDESLQQNAEIKCSVPVIENGNVVGDKQVYNEDEILDFNCSSTYMPAHHRPSKCTKFGTAALWDPTPECETILCRLSLPPPRGTTYDPPFRNLFSPGDTLGVICEDTQDTPAVTTCKDDGKWTSMPKCNGITCNRRDIQNTDIVNLKQKYRDGEQANYVCKNDYEGRFSLTCTKNGWEGNEQCKEVTCPVPVITNGHVLGDIQEYQQHDILEFQCNEKYKAVEERPSICTKLGQRAEWSPTHACEPITCRLLVAVEGTRHDPPFKNVFLPDESVTVTCGDEYYITRPQDTSAVATCKNNGEWDFVPQCKVVICYNPDTRHLKNPRVFLRQNNRMGSTVDYECKTGYRSTDDTNQAKCSRNGWTPNPLCQVIACNGLPTHIQNAYPSNPQQIYYYGQRVNYICDEGFEGGFTITCKENGWRGNPNCKRRII